MLDSNDFDLKLFKQTKFKDIFQDGKYWNKHVKTWSGNSLKQYKYCREVGRGRSKLSPIIGFEGFPNQTQQSFLNI